MKKLIVFVTVFSLLASAAFAEASIGGSVGFGARVIQGDNSKKYEGDADVTTAVDAHWGELHFVWKNDENSAGAKVKINSDFQKDPSGNGHGEFPIMLGGNLWWRPFDFLRIEFTNLEDEGVMGRGNAVDWGYNANSSPGNVTALWGDACGWNSYSNGALKRGTGFFGGIGGGGENVLFLSVTPIDGLAVNVAWALSPLPDSGENNLITGSEDTLDLLNKTLAQITYEINGIGEIGLSVAATEGYDEMIAWAQQWTAHTLAADFTLTKIEGMSIEIGGKVPLVGKIGNRDDKNNDIKIPAEIGVGYTLNQWDGSKPFHLYSRLGVLLRTDDYQASHFGLDINPSYDVNGMFRVFAEMGFAMILPEKADNNFFWHFSPYIRKGIGIGDFYAGFSIWNGKQNGGYQSVLTYYQKNVAEEVGLINWAIPIYFEVSF
jgi:hypothetical protein